MVINQIQKWKSVNGPHPPNGFEKGYPAFPKKECLDYA